MSVKVVLIAGEGKNELGDWALDPAYRSSPPAEGVLEALARLQKPSGWQVTHAWLWCKIPHYRPGAHRGAEARAVLGLVQWAKERKFDAILFARDRDSAKREGKERERSFADGLEAISSEFSSHPAIVGEMAVERLESWVLAVAGQGKSESLSKAQADSLLLSLGVAPKDTLAMVALVRRSGLASVAADAASLRSWLGKVSSSL